jgi:two-component system chemotaxis response regulator CheB
MSVSYNRGATVIAESEATATVFGMPRELIEAGCVHHILESHHIAQTVMRICA